MEAWLEITDMPGIAPGQARATFVILSWDHAFDPAGGGPSRLFASPALQPDGA